MGALGSIGAWILSWRISAARHEGSDSVRQAGFAAAISELKTTVADRDEMLRSDIRDMRDEFSGRLDELQKSYASYQAAFASQEKVNIFTSEAIKGIVATQERQGDKISDHAASLKLLTELVTRERAK